MDNKKQTILCNKHWCGYSKDGVCTKEIIQIVDGKCIYK
jgi:hypothetical protein